MTVAAIAAETEALQAALSGEHAALYGIGVAGGQARYGSTLFSTARALFDAHRTRRDRWFARLLALGADPVPAQPAYGLPLPVTGSDSATTLLRLIEQRCEPLYADLAGASPDRATRDAAVTALLRTAERVVGLGGTPEALPGG